MKRTFIVSGDRPAAGAATNRFLRACDLGIEGVFIPFTDRLVAIVNADATPAQLAAQPGAIRAAYAALGCMNVVVEGVGTDDCA